MPLLTVADQPDQAAGPVASFYGVPAVKPLFAAFSLTFFVSALSSTQSALLNREMDFRSLELRQILSYAAGAVIGGNAGAALARRYPGQLAGEI